MELPIIDTADFEPIKTKAGTECSFSLAFQGTLMEFTEGCPKPQATVSDNDASFLLARAMPQLLQKHQI